jgi:putative peptidoglycan lipid II flippase
MSERIAMTGVPDGGPRLFGATVFLTAASVVNLLVNLATQVAAAKFFGAGVAMDAYQAAMGVPQWLQVVLGVALTAVFVPFFVGAFRREEGAGWRAAATVVTWTLLFVPATALAAALGGRALIALATPGAAVDRALAARLLLITLPAGVLLMLNTILVSLCHARLRFMRPAVGTFVNGLFVFAFLVAFYRRLGIAALPWANLGGNLLSLAVVGSFLLMHSRYRPRLTARGTDLGRAVVAGLPLVAAAVLYQSEPVVRNYVASFMSSGALAGLGYARRLLDALLLATVGGLAAAIFPFLARATAEADCETLRARFTLGVSGMLFLALPFAALAVPLAHPGVRGLFQRGAFTADDTRLVANLFWLYLPAYVTLSLGMITSSTLYALRRTMAVSLVGLGSFAVFVAALVGLVRVLRPHDAIYSMPLAWSAYGVAGLTFAWGVIRRDLGRIEEGALLGALWRFGLSAAVAGVIAYGLFLILEPFTPHVVVPVLLAGLMGLAAYAALTLMVFRSAVSAVILERLAAALGRRRKE